MSASFGRAGDEPASAAAPAAATSRGPLATAAAVAAAIAASTPKTYVCACSLLFWVRVVLRPINCACSCGGPWFHYVVCQTMRVRARVGFGGRSARVRAAAATKSKGVDGGITYSTVYTLRQSDSGSIESMQGLSKFGHQGAD